MFTSVSVVLGLMAVSFLILVPARAAHGWTAENVVVRPVLYGLAAFGLAAPVIGPLAAAAAALAMSTQEAGVAAARRGAVGRDTGAKLMGCLGGHVGALAPVVGAILIASHAPMSDGVLAALWIFAGALSGLCLLALLPVWPLDGGRCLTLILDACPIPTAAVVTATAPLVFVALALRYESAVGVALVIVGALLAMALRAPSPNALDRRAAALALVTWLTTAAAHATALITVLSVF